MQVTDRAGVPPDELAALATELAVLTTLQDVVRWTFGTHREILDVVIQDEFTHDVVVTWGTRRYLVFDTT